MAALVRSHDWAATPLGAIEHWPQSLRTVVDLMLASPGPASIIWGPGRIQLYNDAYIPIAAERHPRLLGRPVAENWSEAHADFLNPIFERVDQGQSVVVENQPVMLRRPDGQGLEERFFTGEFTPIRDATGAVGGMFHPLVETTARIKAERHSAATDVELRESAARLRMLVELVPNLLWQADPTGLSISFNPRWLDYTGQTLEQTQNHGWLAAVHPDDRTHTERLLEQAYAAGQPLEVEHRVRDRHGQYRWFLMRQMPLHDADGRIVRWFGAAMDIHEQRTTLEALRQSEQRLRLLAENVAVGQFTWDLVTGWVTFPPLTREVFGFGDEPVHADRVFERIHPQDLPAVTARMEQALDPSGDGAVRASFRVVHADGSVRWVDSAGQVQFETQPDGSRRAVYVIGMMWDVTEHQQMVERLRQTDERKNEFLAMLAHELRNPLAPLTNALRLLERTTPVTDSGRTALTMAQRQTQQLRRLVDDLLEISRIKRGLIKVRPEPMSIGAAVHAAVESVAPMVEQRAQAITVHVPPAPVRIQADPARIAQVLENLLTNASKYTPEGGAIRIEVEPEANAVAIRVIDNGVGIEPAKIGDLFEVFHQIDTTLDRSQGGLGIGLALVKRLVELHGGTVTAESQGLGKGATFTARLPREQLGAA